LISGYPNNINRQNKPDKPNKTIKPEKKRRGMFLPAAVLFLVAALLIGGSVSYNYVMKNNIDPGEKKEIAISEDEAIEFLIPSGSSTAEIAALLKENGFIRYEKVFRLLSKINGHDGKYQSGTHILSKSLSYDEIMRVLTQKPESKQVTIPEGKTVSQIADILYENKLIKSKEQFIETCNTETFDYDFLKDLPQRDNKLEGYLFPDTYRIDMNTSDKGIINMMLRNFSNKFKDDYKEHIKDLKGMTMDKIVILASIIEREAKTSEDRDIISGVFYNRLNSKDKTLRKLQSCATIQYILLKTTGSVKERLFEADLALEDRYNTYLYEGLPPGPICCPGEESLKAALYPEKTDNLYFVAKSDGTHVFSKTFKEHQAAIERYGLR
jgi:UPF0755 protein